MYRVSYTLRAVAMIKRAYIPGLGGLSRRDVYWLARALGGGYCVPTNPAYWGGYGWYCFRSCLDAIIFYQSFCAPSPNLDPLGLCRLYFCGAWGGCSDPGFHMRPRRSSSENGEGLIGDEEEEEEEPEEEDGENGDRDVEREKESLLDCLQRVIDEYDLGAYGNLAVSNIKECIKTAAIRAAGCLAGATAPGARRGCLTRWGIDVRACFASLPEGVLSDAAKAAVEECLDILP